METQHGHRKIMIVLGVLFALAVLVGGGALGYFWYKKTHSTQSSQTGTNTSGGSIALDTTEKVETESIQTALVLPGPNDKPGDQIKASVLSLTVPKAWRAVNAKNVLNATEKTTPYVAAINDILAQLLFVPEKAPTDPLQAINGFSLYNTTTWLKQTGRSINGQAVTPAMKTAWLANIENIGNGKPADPNVCKNSVDVVDVTICTKQLKPTPIVTKDGSLRGVAFLNTQAQSISYDPRVFVYLTGKVKDQQLLAYGTFHLLDNASHTLRMDDENGMKAAWDAFVAGNVPSDTMQLYQHVIDAMKSITIQAN